MPSEVRRLTQIKPLRYKLRSCNPIPTLILYYIAFHGHMTAVGNQQHIPSWLVWCRVRRAQLRDQTHLGSSPRSASHLPNLMEA